ncbi:MAG: MFS transporter [Pseudomonadota bacterium]|nr:MAG: MFS transporter [Pseudomonadota bacterium]
MDRMKRNVVLLAGCQALMMSANSLLLATSALVGSRLAVDATLATLPLAMQFLATMLTTFPASFLMARIGRRGGFMVGSLLGLAGAGLAAYAIVAHSFALFVGAAVLFGAHNGFGTFYRFAASDTATPDYRPTAISYVMAGGVVAAFVGPNLANWTSDWLGSAQFAGSFLALLGIYVVSLIAVLFIDIPRAVRHEAAASARPLGTIARQSVFVVAALAAALGYGVMNLVMVASPLAMHNHAHPFSDTAFVIQWHVFAMFAPSFFTGHLIKRFGVLNMLIAGAVLNAACVVVNLSGTSVLHFWSALFLLGVGWNFLFVGGTTLLTEAYREEEKAKTQALNDFLMYTSITLTSFTAGALQHRYGWEVVNLGVVPLIVLVLGAVIWLLLRRRALSFREA